MPAYRSIDHVMLRLPAADHVLHLLSNTFGLPVAWPLQRAEFATYCWVHVGNTDLEMWAAASNADLPPHALPPLVHGFALEPALTLPDTLARIVASGIGCKPPRAFQTMNASAEQVTNFTNAFLLDLSSPSCCVFLCEWNAEASIYPWSEPETPVQRRAQFRALLSERGGGPLGLVGLQTIHMGTPSLERHLRQWQALSGSCTHPVQLTADIALELYPAEHLQIDALSFAVRSLDVARHFLASRHLIEADQGGMLAVACEGLHIRLVQQTPA